MRIKSVTMQGFKCFDHQSYSFADRVHIAAENFKGKTSIAETVSVALFGVTLSGSPFTDHLIKRGEKQYEVSTVVEINGGEHEIVRVKGARKSEVYLDGAKVSQVEIDRLLPTKEQFLTVFNPGYFTSLAEKDARELLMSLIKPPKREDVLAQLTEPEQKLLEHEPMRDPDGRAKELRAEIKDNEADIQRTEGKMEALQERINRPLPESMEFSVAQHEELEKLRKQLDTLRDGSAVELRELESQQRMLRTQYQTLKSQLSLTPAEPDLDAPCPTCGQALDDKHRARVVEEHEKRVLAVEAANQELTKRMKELIEEGNDIKVRIEKLATHVPDESAVQELQAQIRALESKKSEAEAQSAYVNRLRMEISDDKQALTKAQEAIRRMRTEQGTMTATVAAINAYRAKLAEMQVAQLSTHLDRVSIQLFDLVKSTGELKACFHVLYDGKPFKSLSRSEGIRANLEFSTLFNRVLGFDVPVYIDNIESVTHYKAPDATQIFEARVVQGAELTVVSESEEKGRVAS
ncbi:hypothetical protein [Alicyclobacillus sp. ALC3]|uniref:hypothetical protein n=1 Tax=Alicyclobacillus sp. ALC3 TaxID=2796143 RepID=UPI0023793917|nr:hypothetical protein [Alicyclobacillus sp. ALC3]WDL96382.1 hypothetical protein JC200_18960 [Alicyclobacillus sp. ALC3]